MVDPAERVEIKRLATGVPNLDPVLGGGIAAFSVNMIVGASGVGKTTLAHQILFHNATQAAPAIYFVALGEPTLKMLRYQQQFGFYEPSKVGSAVLYYDLGAVARSQGLMKSLDFIVLRVEEINPALIVIDSFRALKDLAQSHPEAVRSFVHDISLQLGAWNVTSLLVGEYMFEEAEVLPEFSAADGIIWLAQHAIGNAVVRRLQVLKMRGQAFLPGKHSFRINETGIEVFPRMLPIAGLPELPLERDRLRFGVPGLDEMMCGGVPRGESVLIAGSTGTGKTLLALHFIAEGIKSGEPGVMVTFEENPREHERKAAAFGWNLQDWERQGMLAMIYLRPTDLSIDEVLARVRESTDKLKAKRVAINSISGFQLSITALEEEEFREAIFRLLATLSSKGVTTVMTTDIVDVLGTFRISPEHISFISDNLIILRYAEIESRLHKALMVLKMRTSDHDKELREYRITQRGIVVERPFTGYSGVLSGAPTLRPVSGPRPFAIGLSEPEDRLLHALLARGEATPEVLAGELGMDVHQARRMLEKLVDIGYVLRTGTKAERRYRVASITPGVRRSD